MTKQELKVQLEIKLDIMEQLLKEIYKFSNEPHNYSLENKDLTFLLEKYFSSEYVKFKDIVSSHISNISKELTKRRDYINAECEGNIEGLKLLVRELDRMSEKSYELNNPLHSLEKNNNFEKVFVSYSSKDKVIAGKLKEYIEKYDFDVFLAHEDIDQSKKWHPEIESELEKMDIFIPLYNQNFEESDWCYQECGAAILKTDFIFPISLDGIHNGKGFISKHQAINLNIEFPDKTFFTTIKSMCKYNNIYWINRLIDKIDKINTEDEISNILQVFTNFTLDAVIANRFFQKCIDNKMILFSHSGELLMPELIKINTGKIEIRNLIYLKNAQIFNEKKKEKKYNHDTGGDKLDFNKEYTKSEDYDTTIKAANEFMKSEGFGAAIKKASEIIHVPDIKNVIELFGNESKNITDKKQRGNTI